MELGSNLSEKSQLDFALVCKAREENDEKAYEELMLKYKGSVYFMMLKMVSNTDDADDLTLEAFAKAFRKLNQYEPNYAFSTWLYRIASNNAIDFLRKKKLKTLSIDKPMNGYEKDAKGFEIESDGLNPEEEFVKKQRLNAIRGVVNQLKPLYRDLVVLRYFDELSYDEIAALKKIPLGTIKAQLYRARTQLHELMHNQKVKKE